MKLWGLHVGHHTARHDANVKIHLALDGMFNDSFISANRRPTYDITRILIRVRAFDADIDNFDYDNASVRFTMLLRSYGHFQHPASRRVQVFARPCSWP